MARDPLTRKLVDRPRFLAKASLESQGDFIARDFSEGVAQGRFKFAVNTESLMTIINWSYVGMLITAINQDSIDETSVEWARFLLFNLGIAQDEIEGLISTALQD